MTRPETFDYIIVGAGTAGCILANRLSANPHLKICVIEAGSKDTSPFLHIPAGFIKTLFNPRWTWQFETEPSEGTAGRRITIPQGRVLGGSSSVNGMVYNRGQHADYNGWAQMGNKGWSYDEVLPFFKRSENRIGAREDIFRGRAGALAITDLDWRHPVCDAFLKGAESLGIPLNSDYNGAHQLGAGAYQRAIYKGLRQSTAKVFLKESLKRGNIQLITDAQVTSVIIENFSARGVRFQRGHGSPEQQIFASREVILSAGAINTPKLLQLSGVGPADLLREHGIPIAVDRAGVGENFRDHFVPRLVARLKNTGTINNLAHGPRLWKEIAKWCVGQPSILSIQPAMMHVFWKSKPDLQNPDIQCTFAPASYKEGYAGVLDSFPGMTCGAYQQRPESRGYVRIRSSSPWDNPVVQPNYLSAPEDQSVVISAMRLVRSIFATPALARFYDRETLPGAQAQSDDELLDFAKTKGATVYHLIGTARMGRSDDRLAVVDEKLLVHGIRGLRVVDASVMPTMPSGNTMAPTMMIAEKAADMIAAS